MTKLQALNWISNEAPECLYGVLKSLGRGVGDRQYRAARRRSSANHGLSIVHGATTTPGAPQGSSRFPCRDQDFGCHFLALRSANLECSSHCRDVSVVRSFPARAFVRRCFAGGPPFLIFRRLPLSWMCNSAVVMVESACETGIPCVSEQQRPSDRRLSAVDVFNLIWEAQGCKGHPYVCAEEPGLIERGKPKISPDAVGPSRISWGGLGTPGCRKSLARRC